MEDGQYFHAPWSKLLKISTILSTFCTIIGVISIYLIKSLINIITFYIILTLILTFLFYGPIFMIRGYILLKDKLIILRLGWSYTLSLIGIISAEADSKATSGSIRTFGNGGFFSFTGFFRNTRIGAYRGFITDHKNAVVLKFANNKKFVITPHNPEEFVKKLNEIIQFQTKQYKT
jgi:hypothetical protein